MNMYLLRVLQEDDIELVRTWMQQDYVSMWFGDADEWVAEMKGRDKEYDFVHHFIVEDNQTPIGFVQYYDYSKIPGEEALSQPPETYGIDYMIGDRQLLGQGIGKILVKIICDKVLIENPSAVRIAADPTIEETRKNVASIKVLEANGFEFDRVSGLYIKNISFK